MGLTASAMPRILAGGNVTKQPHDRTVTMLLTALLMTNGGDAILKRVDPAAEKFQAALLDEVREIGRGIDKNNVKLAEVMERLDQYDRHQKTAKVQ